jgi:hypothetical protein
MKVVTATGQLNDLLKEFDLKFKPTDNVTNLKVSNQKTKPSITISSNKPSTSTSDNNTAR